MKKIFVLFLALAFSLVLFAPEVLAKNEGPKHNLKETVFVHWPGKRPPVGSPCQDANSDTVKDFDVAGWHMPDSGLTYKISTFQAPGNIKSAAISPIKNSFATWTATDSKQIFEYEGTSSLKTAKQRDGENTLSWGTIGSNAIAITYISWWGDTGLVDEIDTIFNKNYPWSINNQTAGDCGGSLNSYDLQNIATHEAGHWVGLDDLYSNSDSGLTMYGYGYLGELRKSSLGTGDTLGTQLVAP